MRLLPTGMRTLWVTLLLGLASAAPPLSPRSLAPAVVDCGCTTGGSTSTSTPSAVPAYSSTVETIYFTSFLSSTTANGTTTPSAVPAFSSPGDTLSSTSILSSTTANGTTTSLSSSTQNGAVIPLYPSLTSTSSVSPSTTVWFHISLGIYDKDIPHLVSPVDRCRWHNIRLRGFQWPGQRTGVIFGCHHASRPVDNHTVYQAILIRSYLVW
ncbi:hypothetical protein QBC39DRAFT_368602 [Podospora conica]|nr:hypothetical protein QBC39DRAFT_368602 [Schizothecium conicum]